MKNCKCHARAKDYSDLKRYPISLAGALRVPISGTRALTAYLNKLGMFRVTFGRTCSGRNWWPWTSILVFSFFTQLGDLIPIDESEQLWFLYIADISSTVTVTDEKWRHLFSVTQQSHNVRLHNSKGMHNWLLGYCNRMYPLQRI